MFDKSAVIEGLKALGRVAVVACLPLLIQSLQAGTIDYKGILTAGAIAVLMALDKYVHEYDGSNKTLKKSEGILPFQSMKHEAVQQAEDHVMQYETGIVNMLFKELEDSKIRQEKCGCESCRKHVESIESMLSKELERIAPKS